MMVNRMKLLEAMKRVSPAIAKRSVVQDSERFTFRGEVVSAYNGEILMRSKVPGLEPGFKADVPSAEIVQLLHAISDEEIDLEVQGSELIIRGKRKKAGIRLCESETPYADVPKPEKWVKAPSGISNALYRASLVCGTDETWRITTCIRVTPDCIEACDNFRMFRLKIKTGFKEEAFIPGKLINAIAKRDLVAFSHVDGCLHLKYKGLIVSVSLWNGQAVNLDPLVEVKGQSVKLPKDELMAAVCSSNVMSADAGYYAKVQLKISGNVAVVSGRGERGWYAEKVKVQYKGPDLCFEVRPDCLIDILEYSSEVIVGKKRIKVQIDNSIFVIAMTPSGEIE